MNTAKKVLSVVLAVMMVAVLAVSTMAATTGKLTISNAEAGKTYSVYKIFDATYAGEDAVSYTTTDAAVAAAAKASGLFDCVEADGVCYIQQKAGTTDAAVITWANDNAAIFTKVAEKNITTGNVVDFDLPYGYYLVKAGNDAVVSIDTNAPSVEIIDKNPKTPGTPDKDADHVKVLVGDTVTYTVTFMATNFKTVEENGETKTAIIDKYTVTDNSENDLANKTMVSVKYYTAVDADGKVTGTGTDITSTVTFANDTFTIPWAQQGTDADKTWSSLYPSPVYVQITYTGEATQAIIDDMKADNTATLTYEVDDDFKGTTPGTPNEGGEDSVHIPTIDLKLEKVDSQDDTIKLEGAKFVLVNADGKFYSYDATTKTVTWVDAEADASVFTSDANGKTDLDIVGVKAGTYGLKEIVAPEGYKLPADPFEIEIKVNETVDADGKKTVDYTVEFESAAQTLNDAAQATLVVANGTGSELPSTGGSGTIALIAAGTVLFMAAAIILVTKKRMYNEQ